MRWCGHVIRQPPNAPIHKCETMVNESVKWDEVHLKLYEVVLEDLQPLRINIPISWEYILVMLYKFTLCPMLSRSFNLIRDSYAGRNYRELLALHIFSFYFVLCWLEMNLNGKHSQ